MNPITRVNWSQRGLSSWVIRDRTVSIVPIFSGNTDSGHFSLLIIDRTVSTHGTFWYFDSWNDDLVDAVEKLSKQMPCWVENQSVFKPIRPGTEPEIERELSTQMRWSPKPNRVTTVVSLLASWQQSSWKVCLIAGGLTPLPAVIYLYELKVFK